jgi:hypothetical protein
MPRLGPLAERHRPSSRSPYIKDKGTIDQASSGGAGEAGNSWQEACSLSVANSEIKKG